MTIHGRPARILLVEDNPGDVRLVREALRVGDISHEVRVAGDGVAALDLLRRAGEHAAEPRPDLILLDLNLPRLDGRSVLGVIKADESLRRIPVVVLTTSSNWRDIATSYGLHANAVVTKPIDLDQFIATVQAIEISGSGPPRCPGRTETRRQPVAGGVQSSGGAHAHGPRDVARLRTEQFRPRARGRPASFPKIARCIYLPFTIGNVASYPPRLCLGHDRTARRRWDGTTRGRRAARARRPTMSTKLKTFDVILAALAAAGFFLFYYATDKLHLTTTEGKAFAVLAVAVVLGAVATFAYDKMVKHPVEVGSTELPQPGISRFLFHDTRSAALWLVLRFYVGLAWLEGGLHKVTDEKWAYGNGSAILGYWQGAVAIPEQGAPRINEEYAWYRDFLTILIDNEAHTWFAPLIAWGEVLVGVGLIVGGLVGIAAFFGALMNMSFMLAGSASTNPVLFFLAVLLMLGWQVAGYYGADRFILPIIGAPWKPGKLFSRGGAPVPVSAS